MASLTRAERQARTRADLLEVAQQRFLADGYAGTSLDAIADAAGYSKGAVYSNFSDKRTLCAVVLDNIHQQKLSEVGAIVSADESLDRRVELINEWLENTVGDVGWTRLEMEFAAGVWRDEELAAMVVSLRNDAHAMVAAMVRTIAGELGISDEQVVSAPIGIDDMAALVLSTGIGLGIQRAVDPTVSVGPAIDAVRLVVGLLSMLGGATPGVR